MDNDTPDIEDMRKALLRMYPDGIIRNQFILRMSDAQIYAIYKSHKSHGISMDGPRLEKPKRQVVGQLSLF